MDKKGITIIAAAIAVMVAWHVYFTSHVKKTAAQNPVTIEAGKTTAAQASPLPSATPQWPAPASTAVAPSATPTTAAAAEQTEKVESASVEYQFTNIGGGIARAVLLKHPVENGGFVTLNERGHSPIGALSFTPGETSEPWQITRKGGLVFAERTMSQGLQITKRFDLPEKAEGKEEYLVRLQVSFANRGAEPFEAPVYYVHTGALGPLHELDSLTYPTSFNWFREGKLHEIPFTWFDASKIPLIGIQTRPATDFYKESADKVAWAGVKNQYFTSLISPEGRIGAGGWATRHEFKLTEAGKAHYAVEGALAMPGFKLAPNETRTEAFNLFVGPREFTRLKKMKQDEDRIMNYGMFRLVSEFLLSSMHWLKGWMGSYGLAIIVLTIVIKAVLWPLQNKATNSAKKMQLLSPRLKELQEKYKDDPLRAQQEYSKLLKQYGVSPFGGCLPMLITIPIFFGFLYMLGQSIELRGNSFLWVKDLSQPDTITRVLGFPINILPLVMALTSFWQMALMPKTGDPVQQRIMMFMPLIFIAFCYNFASALALYYTVQNLFSILQLYVTRDQAPPTLEIINPPQKPKKRTNRK